MSTQENEQRRARIKHLRTEARELDARASTLHRDMEILRQQNAAAVYGLSVGAIVRDVHNGKLFKVVRFQGSDDSSAGEFRPWVYGNPQNKNGSFGKAERCLYRDWELTTQK